jgi:CHAT domain-containing protein
MVSSLGEALARADSSTFSSNDRGLIVSVTSPVSASGNRLPALAAAREEAAQLRERMPHAVLLTDAEAAPAAIAHEMADATLFHFAGHGWANGGNGGLVLDSAARMGAGELAAQNWKHCRLAVLSACLTAAGEERGPVNNRSLVMALMTAGARQVIAARWSVDERATQALMGEFYSRLFAGSNAMDALAGAEAHVAAMNGWSHPYYWAGFDVFGSQ